MHKQVRPLVADTGSASARGDVHGADAQPGAGPEDVARRDPARDRTARAAVWGRPRSGLDDSGRPVGPPVAGLPDPQTPAEGAVPTTATRSPAGHQTAAEAARDGRPRRVGNVMSADAVAKSMGQAIRDALFSEWDFPMQRLRCAHEEESFDPEGDPDVIEVVDGDGDVWRIDLTIAAKRVGNIKDRSDDGEGES